jgi:hypothetical protein
MNVTIKQRDTLSELTFQSQQESPRASRRAQSIHHKNNDGERETRDNESLLRHYNEQQYDQEYRRPQQHVSETERGRKTVDEEIVSTIDDSAIKAINGSIIDGLQVAAAPHNQDTQHALL